MKREWKRIMMGIGTVAIFGVVIGWFCNFGMIGPGLPPSINGWYFPQPDGRYNDGTQIFANTGAEHYGMNGPVSRICPEMFPVLSSDCIQAQYERFYANDSGMDSHYIVISWYFNDAIKFSDAEHELNDFLKRSGTVSDISLDLNPEFQRISALRADNVQYSFTSVPVSQYTSNVTSGYFITYARPLIRDRQDYIVMYYGVLNDSDIRAHATFLTTLLVKGGFPQDPDVISQLSESR
ncbi:MAG: hypothetical protein M0R30_13020 [Methanoregula sp.]|jgi:hypothetical protein|uniref:hypothetical protein n=1 Tax=Methanoregula sp. TaxID=2052170 RepID=UPI0025F8EC49|nr:hypothetical protein [Methanoregula sp.]MCK9632546.1 hypothetical protein [Methanoregula sp.]